MSKTFRRNEDDNTQKGNHRSRRTPSKYDIAERYSRAVDDDEDSWK